MIPLHFSPKDVSLIKRISYASSHNLANSTKSKCSFTYPQQKRRNSAVRTGVVRKSV